MHTDCERRKLSSEAICVQEEKIQHLEELVKKLEAIINKQTAQTEVLIEDIQRQVKQFQDQHQNNS